MDPERVRCKAEGCDHTILPETAARTGGYCMRCVQKRAQEERVEYIRKNRREVDPYEELDEPIDLIKAYHVRRRPDPLVIYKPCPKPIEELYAALSSEDAQRLARFAAENKRDGDGELAEAIAVALATFTDVDLDEIQSTWVDRGEYWPSVIFRGAASLIRDKIIEQFQRSTEDSRTGVSLGHALCALAWIGDATVQARFHEWEQSPPAWRKRLHFGPSEYAKTAGWELVGVARRDLFMKRCFAVKPVREGEVSDSAVSAFQPSDQKCPWCERALVTMFSFDRRDSRFDFLGFPGITLPVLTCDACTCFTAQIFGRIVEDGRAVLHEGNKPPGRLPVDASEWRTNPWSAARIVITPTKTLRTAGWSATDNASQIGGVPAWVQEDDYPRCPDCGDTMIFIAQLDNGVFRNHDGVYYAFLCTRCRVTATCYQQT